MKTKLLLTCILAFFLTAITQAASYIFTDLGSLPPYNFFSPTGINNSGAVVGTAYDTGGRPVAFRHTSGAFQMIASPGPAHSAWGNGINSAGTIVGLCDRTGSRLHAFYSNLGGPAVDFDSDFTRNSEAVAINDFNYVVGTASSQAFLGNTGGWMMLLGDTLGENFRATDINNSFVLTGNNGAWGGLTYNAWSGSVTYLGWALGSFNNRAGAINESGVVAGKKGTQGFLYDGGAVTYFGASVSEVKAINASGNVVGTANGRAFVYLRASSTFIDLNTAIAPSVAATWTLISATGINDSGVICGQARRLATPADGPGYGMYVYRAFKLTPLPIIIFPLPITIIP
jgi:probable HAF family extracellular repeat protein